jgi:hypothetical protein
MIVRAVITSLLTLPLAAGAADMAVLCADRAAIERVYHEHRIGTKNSFEETMPPAQIERLVQLDMHKEAVLKAVYQADITPAMVDAEVSRINATTRAPGILAEIKAALGDDPARFARSMARPLIVERVLRARFENDDNLHALPRHQAEAARSAALAARPQGIVTQNEVLKRFGEVHITQWGLGPRAPAAVPPAPVVAPPATKGTASGGAYSVEATAQVAQSMNASQAKEAGTGDLYFEDLNPELRKVLAAQLKQVGDVSAVVEMPGGFAVFALTAITPATLSVVSLSLPKRNYDEWLNTQPQH